jgi:HPt (histidine-containing phosphotransfer) domain-containing protein
MLSNEDQELEMPHSTHHPRSVSASSQALPDSAPVDWAGVLEDIGGDESLLRELIGTLVDFYPETLQGVRDALARNDLPAVSRGAHRLKGAVSNFGLGPAFEAARSLEESANASQLEATRAAFEIMERELERLSEKLQSYGRAPAP